MGKKDEYLALMETQMKQWDAAVDQLAAKSGLMTEEARTAYEKQVKALRADRDLAYEKMQELRQANESAWQHMQAGMESAWTSMQNALDKAMKQYK